MGFNSGFKGLTWKFMKATKTMRDYETKTNAVGRTAVWATC